MARAVPTQTLDDDTLREAMEFISENLRPADRAEVQAMRGPEDPYWALVESWDASTATWLILDRSGLPIGLFGVAAHLVPGVGQAWLLGTDGMEEDALSVARQTPRFVKELHRYFPILTADVDARNVLSLEWLEWAGFQLADANPNFGPESRLFFQYVRSKPRV